MVRQQPTIDLERKPAPSAHRFLPPLKKWLPFVVHQHYQPHKRRTHWDLRILVPSSGGLRSFAVPKMEFPKGKTKRGFYETPIHPIKFLTFEHVRRENGKRNGESWKIVDKGLYYAHRADKGIMILTFRGKTKKAHGTFVFVRTHNYNWIVKRYSKIKRPKMSKDDKVEIMASLPNKSSASISQIFRHWKADQDPEWRKASEKFPEFEVIQKSWRKLVHDFWRHQSAYSKTFKSIQQSANKGIWREDDLYMLKQEFFDLRQPAGQLVLKVKRGLEKEAKVGIQIAKTLKYRQSHPKIKIYRTIARYGMDQIWRLLVVLMFDQPHLFGIFDRASVGREWTEVWSKLGLLGKGDGPK